MEELRSSIIEDDHQWRYLNYETLKADEEEAATFMTQLFKSTTLDPFMATLDHDHHNNNNLDFEMPYNYSSSIYNMLNSQENGNINQNNYDDDDDHKYLFLGNYNINNNGGGNFNLEIEHSMNLQLPCFEDELVKLPQHQEMGTHDKIHDINYCNKRSSRGFGDHHVHKKSNERSKKTQKLTSRRTTQEDGNDAGLSRHSSEDEFNASLEINGGANDFGSSSKESIKSRASRGTATDPQSMYARRRRKRINERLKILQTLVPNGTKVDLSTMLEEAVQYVKFLQLQIKLLSSDDLWMYAPIAYNGIDIGLNPTPKNTSKES